MSEAGNLESQLQLKIGAQVMLISNLDIDDRLVNGLVGTVKQIKYKNNEVSVVHVKFNDNNAGREAMQSDVTAQQHNWVPIKKHQALFGLRKNKQQPSVKRTQFSLTLSWACTAHKVQGLSLAEGVVRLDLSSMNKMYLIGSYNKPH